jgi:hypothetical protein
MSPGAPVDIVAHVVLVARCARRRLEHSTVPEVQFTVRDGPRTGRSFQLFNAPVPNSSSEPNDRVVENLSGLGPKLYRGFKVWSTLEVFF